MHDVVGMFSQIGLFPASFCSSSLSPIHADLVKILLLTRPIPKKTGCSLEHDSDLHKTGMNKWCGLWWHAPRASRLRSKRAGAPRQCSAVDTLCLPT